MPLIVLLLILLTNYVLIADLSAGSRSIYLIVLALITVFYFLSVYFF